MPEILIDNWIQIANKTMIDPAAIRVNASICKNSANGETTGISRPANRLITQSDIQPTVYLKEINCLRDKCITSNANATAMTAISIPWAVCWLTKSFYWISITPNDHESL